MEVMPMRLQKGKEEEETARRVRKRRNGTKRAVKRFKIRSKCKARGKKRKIKQEGKKNREV